VFGTCVQIKFVDNTIQKKNGEEEIGEIWTGQDKESRRKAELASFRGAVICRIYFIWLLYSFYGTKVAEPLTVY